MRNLQVFLILPLCWQICNSLSAQFGVNTHGYQASINIGVQFRYCRFSCFEKCSSTSKRSTDSAEDKFSVPSGYYWRDFYGVAPPDALPLGGSNQNPQTYIGLVYDPAHNGSFVTTIFDGVSYVYNTLHGKSYKLTEHIQILCTMEPHKLVWMELTEEIIKNLKNRKNVLGGYHIELSQEKKTKLRFHFIAKDSSTPITYGGAVSTLNDTLEYAKIDGTVGATNKLTWLMFITEESKGESNQKSERKCGRYFHFKYQLGSIPKFYRNFNLASCTFTCSQGSQNQMDKFKTDKRLRTSMEYHWKPNTVFRKEEALLAGHSTTYPELYIAQAFIEPDIYDVGYSSSGTNSAYITQTAKRIIGIGYAFHIFSTTSPEKFEWVNSTSTDFDKLDKDLIIPGGGLSNGTTTYVGRELPEKSFFPGTIHITPGGAVLQSFYSSPLKFQVLKFKG